MGVPEIDPLKQRPALQMAKFCIGLFNAMGVNVTLNDTDTTHRVPSWNSSLNSPKPYNFRICATNHSCRREITQASPTAASINNGDLSNALILDHLTPKAQELLFEAKNLKNR